MKRFAIHKNTIHGEQVVLKGSDVHHIRDVLRYKEGDTLCLFDSNQKEYQARIISISSKEIIFQIDDHRLTNTESKLKITLAQSMVKERKMDTIIRQATELGIYSFIPFYSERSIPKYKSDRIQNRHQRWQKIVYEAIKQCRRTITPFIHPPMEFSQLIQTTSYSNKILFWENASVNLSHLSSNNHIESILIIIGPEGGFSDQEATNADHSGCQLIKMGHRILKAETAAIIAVGLIQYIFGDFV